MSIYVLDIPLKPVPWAAHKGFGKRAYNPRYKEKKAFQSIISTQWEGEPINCEVELQFLFYLPYPKSWSKKKKERESPIRRPDCSNMIKAVEDFLKGIVIIDDSIVTSIIAKKLYAEVPRTIVTIITKEDKSWIKP